MLPASALLMLIPLRRHLRCLQLIMEVFSTLCSQVLRAAFLGMATPEAATSWPLSHVWVCPAAGRATCQCRENSVLTWVRAPSSLILNSLLIPGPATLVPPSPPLHCHLSVLTLLHFFVTCPIGAAALS